MLAVGLDKSYSGYDKQSRNEVHVHVKIHHLDCLFRIAVLYTFIRESTIQRSATSSPFCTVCAYII